MGSERPDTAGRLVKGQRGFAHPHANPEKALLALPSSGGELRIVVDLSKLDSLCGLRSAGEAVAPQPGPSSAWARMSNPARGREWENPAGGGAFR